MLPTLFSHLGGMRSQTYRNHTTLVLFRYASRRFGEQERTQGFARGKQAAT